MRVRLPHCRKPGSRIIAAALAGVLLVTAPIVAATAQERRGPPIPPNEESPDQKIARDAIEKMMRALSQAIQNLPQYEMPTINERGDIIIKRKNPPSQKSPRRAPEGEDSTRT
jgi:hypothetical protein